MVMVGEIAELDESARRVRVDADGMRTDWIPWGERRAGPTARSWWPPDVGEQVVVVCPYGDPSQGIVIASIYRSDFPAPADAKAVRRTVYPDGSVVEYDSDAHKLTVNAGSGSVVVNCKTATVQASNSVELDSQTVHATGNLKVDGDVTANGNVKGANVTASGTVQGGTIKAGSIDLAGHHHTAQGATAPTTPAQA